MVEPRIHPPPPPTTPRLAPWDAVQELCNRLDRLIVLLEGVAPPAPPPEWPGWEPIIRKLDALIAGLVENLPAFQTGQKDVATAGTPEQLDDFPIPVGFKLTVIAKTGNTGYIYLGKDKGDCANSSRRFDGLSAGLAVSLRVKNANAVWVDSSAQGTTAAPEGVSWIVERR